jgi:hypothetical protein
MRHRICIQGRYNAPLSPPASPYRFYLLLFLSHFFSTLAIFERDKGRICREARLDKTLHPPLSAAADATPSFQKRYKRVRARAIRQRCNAVPRAPLSRCGGFRVSSILCHRSARLAPRDSKNERKKKIQGGAYL